MKVIGITGGVGAGKSSVLALLKEMCSCDIIQADLVARNIYHSGNIGFKKVVDIFGEQIVGEDGEINRPLLADIIFKNPNKRIVLNSIIHPLVKQEIINQINNHKIAGDVDYCFVEAALLIEDHYDIFMDEIWYIYVSEDERRKRLAASRGYSDEKISGIFKSLSIFINGSEIMRVENSISDFINTSVLAFKPNSRRSLSSTAFAK